MMEPRIGVQLQKHCRRPKLAKRLFHSWKNIGLSSDGGVEVSEVDEDFYFSGRFQDRNNPSTPVGRTFKWARRRDPPSFRVLERLHPSEEWARDVPTERGRHHALEVPKIDLFVHGNLVPVLENIRILGLRIEVNGQYLETIRALEKSVHKTARLITRIANKNHGIKEANLVRLVEAFVLSRIVYVTPFLRLRADERSKINNMIKKAYKQALRIPVSAPNEPFEALGIHNTLD